MPPIVYVIRHGEGEHNINNSHHLRDPLLTDKGKAQCLELRKRFPSPQNISLILASPLQRTIQTAAYVFAPGLDERQIPLVLTPEAQEISGLTCDLGHDVDFVNTEAPKLIKKAAPSYSPENLDTSLVGESWNSKKGFYAPTLSAVQNRAAELRKWIRSRPEKEIALVSHGGFLHYLTEDWTGYDKSRSTGYLNCEYRKLEFTPDSSEEQATLVECGNQLEKQARPVGLDSHLFLEIEQVEKTGR